MLISSPCSTLINSIGIVKAYRCGMPKDNLLYKLDNLDYQYNYLNGTLENFQPRLNGTSKAYNAKGKKSSKRISKLLEELKKEDVERQLDELCIDIFQKKIFHLDGKLRQFIEKQLIQYKPSKKSKNDFTPVIKNIKKEYGLEKFSELISKSKVIKLSLSKIHPAREPPKWFTKHEFWKIHNDKDDEYNPSRIWNEVVLKTDGCNQLLSSLLNNNKCKELIAGFNSGMDVFLNINKDKKEKSKEEKAPQKEKEISKIEKKGENHESSDENGEQDDDGDESDESSESQLQDEGGNEELDEELLKQYDGMLAASDEENEEGLQLDPNINYNEVTDEEPSDDEKESEDEDNEEDAGEPETKKPKYQLPELMAGYYSGGDSSDDDLANDRIAQEQMSNKTQRKNRRGQRARRKIWEQKFGDKANHVMKERKAFYEKKKKKQQEFEEREAKRAAKAAKASEFERKLSQDSKKEAPRKPEPKPNAEPAAEHPSWIAKREAEAKLKNAKFEGKKVVFD
ncbi:hypothetical protein ZYGR_0AM00450 [Zygosaccharomyces rouxii]|uniref:Bud22 domain-containing protein n=1 Tax=Zygosaccharomyces rouxii TaxID=4956 RepID=A0A1Q3AFK8_ZYGRO|nr:hypothetical protein ZYGR_0AM00450 [Zygosaccharomyces rouxii]